MRRRLVRAGFPVNRSSQVFRCERLAEDALLVTLGDAIGEDTARRVRAFARAAERCAPSCDIVPAFASVALIGAEATPALAEVILAASEADAPGEDSARLVEIPVCYGGEFGPDLDDIARHVGLPPGEVIARHAGAEYTVDALGFAPGFPYLRGLDPRLEIPRRATPRTGIPSGSVGIGGAQTGVYRRSGSFGRKTRLRPRCCGRATACASRRSHRRSSSASPRRGCPSARHQ